MSLPLELPQFMLFFRSFFDCLPAIVRATIWFGFFIVMVYAILRSL